MGFNSAFKGLKLLKTPGNGRLNNLNNLALNVLNSNVFVFHSFKPHAVSVSHHHHKDSKPKHVSEFTNSVVLATSLVTNEPTAGLSTTPVL